MKDSYMNILKSTGVVGLVQVFKLIFGFIQNKVLAILIGPAGFGVWGLYNTFVIMISSFSTLGVDQAGVQQISKNVNNEKRLSDIIWVLRKTILFLSLIFVGVIIFFSQSISNLLFGTESYSLGIKIISFAILLNSFTLGQISILNGLSEIKKIAKSQIYGVIVGSIFSIIFILIYGQEGIPFFILTASIVPAYFTWLYVKKNNISLKRPSFFTIKKDLSALLIIGLGIAYSAIIVAISTYLIQTYIRKEFGLDVLGIYNASFTISNIYIGIILSAMGVDLMPRLSKVIEEKELVSKMINNQMELGLLLSSIGIVAVILFAPIIFNVLYSQEFSGGVEILRWQILGVFLRVLSFPLGYVLIIKRRTMQYMVVQSVMWLGNYLFLILLNNLWGIKVLGLNYLFAYIIYVILLFFFLKNEFNFSKLVIKVLLISLSLIIVSWLIGTFLSFYLKIGIGSIILIINLYWIIYFLKNEMHIDVTAIIKSKFIK